MKYWFANNARRGSVLLAASEIKDSVKPYLISDAKHIPHYQALFMRFNTLQFALPTGNFVKYFPTNN